MYLFRHDNYKTLDGTKEIYLNSYSGVQRATCLFLSEATTIKLNALLYSTKATPMIPAAPARLMPTPVAAAPPAEVEEEADEDPPEPEPEPEPLPLPPVASAATSLCRVEGRLLRKALEVS